MIGLATVLPLLLLTTVILIKSYDVVRSTTYQGIEETCHRIATDFEVHLENTLGLIKGASLAADPSHEADIIPSLLAADPGLREVWIRHSGEPPEIEAPYRKKLFEAVLAGQTEVLSSPDFHLYQASLGVPRFRDGKAIGMIGVSFSLDYFQAVVSQIKLFSTGYAFMVSHDGIRIAHPDRSLVGKKIGGDVEPDRAQWMLAKVAEGQAFWLEKRALVTGKWSRQYYSPVTVGKNPSPWFLVIVTPEDEAVRDVNSLFVLMIVGILGTLALVAAATWFANKPVIRALEDQEELVKQRTARLEESLTTLEQAQAKLVETEKMAILGQLTATIAHEINTPLGAIRSSASFLNNGLIARMGDASKFLKLLSPSDYAWYQDLVNNKKVSLQPPDGAEERKRRRNLSTRITEMGVADPGGIAEDIVFLVPPERDEELLAGVARGLGPVIRRAAETAGLFQSSAIILESADRAAATVTALVDYAHSPDILHDRAIELSREFDTLLTLYYGISKQKVTIVREFQPGLMVQGDRERLNQVWVNLINNALQAMGYQGTLTLRARAVGALAEVSFINDGPSIPEDIRDKIFLPFFTTRKAGEGSGLGLDICRKIVEAHRGTLTLTQEGPLTVFTVRIPQPPPDERSLT